MAHQIVWCDIPVRELDRALQFYSAVLGTEVRRQEMAGVVMGVLPHNDGEVGGCLVLNPQDVPSATGVMIYLNANGRLDEAIAAVEPHGGRILQPKQPIGPFGFRAVVVDSEGNRIALHSDSDTPQFPAGSRL